MSYVRLIEGRSIIFLVADQWLFEQDVSQGLIGEALASILIFPYQALSNSDFLYAQEVALKRRLILELLENLVLSYPELSHDAHIKPEYFMYELIMNRIKVFPPNAYGASSFLSSKVDADKVEAVLQGYKQALKDLEKDKIIHFNNGEVTLTAKFIKASKTHEVRLMNISKAAPRVFFTFILSAFPQLLNFISMSSESFSQLRLISKNNSVNQFIDPLKYVAVSTSRGFVSLGDKADIRTFARKMFPNSGNQSIKVEEYGGILNDIYLIHALLKDVERKILVKRFKDWSNFKWFPLTMWAAGARSFAVSARSRLERECAINELLRTEGIAVPKILHVSATERLVFMEFIEGEDLSNVIKRISMLASPHKAEKELATIRTVGEIYAKIHKLNAALGDTKPENVMVCPDGKLYLLDLEQASRGGDKAWDIAEFLYFSGHYIPFSREAAAEAICKAFISGYIGAGGEVSVVNSAGSSKYARVFTIYTSPSILRVMTKTCKQTKKAAS